MNAALTHRGPDATGIGSFQHAELAMSRLAIIDVVGGHQPVNSNDGRYAAVVNGEIYNFRELRAELEHAGHRFRSAADSEVIVHGFAEWGEDSFSKLSGMFAVAVYDRDRKRLVLGRDRFGEKPLFYYERPGGLLAFSSELRSLLEHPAIPREADFEALGYYLRLGLIPEPKTPFAGVRSLPPGSILRWESGTTTVHRFHTVNYVPDPRLADDRVAEEAVEAALSTAVQRQAVSDVPLGAFLSGGIDSSLIVALLQRSSTRRVKTFTVCFEDAGYDESPVARETARHLGTEHVEIHVPNTSFDPQHLHRIVDHAGIPFADSSALPMYELSRRVREHVTVALSGDGGDELFAGYKFFRWGRDIRRLGCLPSPLLGGARRAALWMGRQPALGRVGAVRKARRALDAAMEPEALMPVMVHSLFEPRLGERLITDAGVRGVSLGALPLVTSLPEEARAWSPLRRLMYYRQAHNLPADMLTKVDRMSMATSLEVRAPMLDIAVADVAARLPDRQLLRGKHGKHVLRRIARRLVPERVLSMPKSGFRIPLHRYLNSDYETLARDLLIGERRLDGILDSRAVKDVLEAGVAATEDRADVSVYKATHQLWALVMLGAWAKRFRVAL